MVSESNTKKLIVIETRKPLYECNIKDYSNKWVFMKLWRDVTILINLVGKIDSSSQ